MLYLAGDANLAEDLTQETFVSAWANIESFKASVPLRIWLHRIAYHKFIDSRRKLKRDTALMARLKEHNDSVSETSNPLRRLVADERSRILYEAVGNLNLPENLVIVLHYIQGLSFREMAKVLDESVGTVKWRTSRALKRLRDFLTGKVGQ